MNLDKELRDYGKIHTPVQQEEHIADTVSKSIDALCIKEEQTQLSYREFFWIQLKTIRKRWWALQALLLWGMWELLFLSQASEDTQRGMSIAASLFVVLIIPELGKNRESDSMEIEAASLYSLKQVYAIRLAAFGCMDVFMLTIFCAITTTTQAISIMDLMKQLLFPMIVVAAICFAILGSKQQFPAVVAIVCCLMASTVWMVIVLNDSLYAAITPAVWGTIFGVAAIVLMISVRKVLYNCNRYWEEKLDGIEIG